MDAILVMDIVTNVIAAIHAKVIIFALIVILVNLVMNAKVVNLFVGMAVIHAIVNISA